MCEVDWKRDESLRGRRDWRNRQVTSVEDLVWAEAMVKELKSSLLEAPA